MNRPLFTPRNTSQDVSYTATHGESSAFGASTKIIRVVATTACRVKIGTAPTAVGTDIYIPANFPVWFGVTPGEKLSAVRETADGKINIVEGDQF